MSLFSVADVITHFHHNADHWFTANSDDYLCMSPVVMLLKIPICGTNEVPQMLRHLVYKSNVF